MRGWSRLVDRFVDWRYGDVETEGDSQLFGGVRRRAASSSPQRMIFHGVVSFETESVTEFFLEREQAEGFIAEVEEDEPETAERLRVEPIELG
jgi:hypothetical protein